MYNLVVDIGNSSTKIGIFLDTNLIYHRIETDIQVQYLQDLISDGRSYNSILSDVANKGLDFVPLLTKNTNLYRFDVSLPLPLKIQYQTPKTLGLDRLAAVLAASLYYPNQSLLVIDAGTCITYDFIDKEANYLGGSISMGLKMRFQALHDYTANLPLVVSDDATHIIGKNTSSSISSGVINGMLGEITTFINHYKEMYNDLKVLFIGGDAVFFEKQLKKTIFASDINFNHPYLILEGLNFAINYQLQHDKKN